jgi:hypothetical protein
MLKSRSQEEVKLAFDILLKEIGECNINLNTDIMRSIDNWQTLYLLEDNLFNFSKYFPLSRITKKLVKYHEILRSKFVLM